MDNQNLPEHTGIKDIVSKIIRTRKLSALSGEEIAVLSEFAGIKTDTTEERKTLLSWIWDKMIKYTFYFDQNLLDISVLNNIILNNSARYFGRNIDEAFWKILSREDLKNLINEAFRLKESADRMNNEKITGGLMLIGLTGMHEYENRIAEICLNENGGSIDIFYEADYIFASLLSLIMLESPKVHEIALRLHDATEEKIRAALMIYYNFFPDRLNENEIPAYKEFLKADRDIALRLPDFTLRVFKDDIKGLNNLFNDKFYNEPEEIWNSLCPAIFRFTNKKLLRKMLDAGNEEVIIRILLYAVYKKEDWIIPLLKEKLDESNQKDADDPWVRLDINVFLS
ncbi:MAG TPA: hypothetical protein VK155_16715, partial [Bacteroidales bacterium]|nr:hypothetical protein [Bacteroidales bacterium]